MYVIESSCVDEALSDGLVLIKQHGVLQDSRAGKVLVVPTPVMTVNHNPTHRVLFNPVRDANPVFHLMESLWMLAGRNDITWLDQFVGDFSKRFGEPDGTQHGAYGFRWRKALGYDQLDEVVKRLRASPLDRQCVIQMWDGRHQMEGSVRYGEGDLKGDWLDRPCNTHIYLRVRDGAINHGPDGQGGVAYDVTKVLDLTVCCRSNDAIWGAHGANAVHFSILQEYLAARIGVGIGKLYQLSNNYHAYVDVFEKVNKFSPSLMVDRYQSKVVRAKPFVNKLADFEQDLVNFFHEAWFVLEYSNDFFYKVALPLRYSYKCWREKDYDRAKVVVRNSEIDWLVAAEEWYARRIEKSLLKGEQTHVG